MNKEDLDRMWSDKNNWTAIGLYKCSSDPRLIVPKQVKCLGWTINVAHSKSIFLSIIIGILALAPPSIVIFKVGQTAKSMTVAFAISAVIVCGACVYFASIKHKF